jgi:release factor glutamine methyltransferase
MPVMAALLSPQGRAFLEIGDGQAEDVGALASAAGLVSAGIHDDLSGVARCISLQK